MHAQFVVVPGGRHHCHHREGFHCRRQRRSLPYVTISISVDDVLQRLAEIAKSVHSLFYRITTEHIGYAISARVRKAPYRPCLSSNLTVPIAVEASACLVCAVYDVLPRPVTFLPMINAAVIGPGR